jgi:uncharacterized membrane protein
MKLTGSVTRWALLIAAVTAYSKAFEELSSVIGERFGDTPIAGLAAFIGFIGLFGLTCLFGMLIEEATGTQLN